ncbi:hypothetical protein M422DRAFT_46232 [Sphaerobolus stellatus SS14]|uniref:Uncharacterized protein n=1 Tax=Sphaerobolus stellatus (strain SS14) TaxID=990650 RepID=A0A0C9W344_SPHS4|nr:hypothetical protein M422DRAFT_46232 [Sphaerobolus stellatus SS14]
MSIDIAQLKESLVPLKTILGSDDVIQRIQIHLRDPAMMDQVAASRRREASNLTDDTLGVEAGYQLGAEVFANLGQWREPWYSKWEVLHKSFGATTKMALGVVKSGIGFYTDFNNKVVGQIDWIEDHFDEAKALVSTFANVSEHSQLTSPHSKSSSFSKSPVGAQLVTDSTKVSQSYTDNKRAVLEFLEELGNSGIGTLSAETQAAKAINECKAEMARLNGEMARCRMETNQIESAVNETLGIPGWITWIMTGILKASVLFRSPIESLRTSNQSIGYGSLEDARQALAALSEEQDRLRALQASVKEKAIRESGQDRIWTLPIVIMAIMLSVDNLVLSASEWAQYRHDIVIISEDMMIAADSATKKALIMRIKSLGAALDALVPSLEDYLMVVGGTGWYD